MLHPNTDPGGSHSTGTASLISTHIAQLNFARHSITIHRTFLYPENKIHVMSTAGKRDELEAPMIFFPQFSSPWLCSFVQREHHEQTTLSRVHRTLGLVCADPQPLQRCFFISGGFIQENISGNTATGWIQDKQTLTKAVTFLQVALGSWVMRLGNRTISQIHWWKKCWELIVLTPAHVLLDWSHLHGVHRRERERENSSKVTTVDAWSN